MIEKSRDDILRTSFYKAQSGIRTVVYKAAEQVMLDVLRKDVIGKKLDAHIAKFLDTNAAPKCLSKRLLASSSFMVLNATFARRKTDTEIKERKIQYRFSVGRAARYSTDV